MASDPSATGTPPTSPNVPAFRLAAAFVTVPTDVQGFQGPKNGPVVSYPLDCQSFLVSSVVLPIPEAVPAGAALKASAGNPYAALLAGLALDKQGDIPGRLLLTVPGCQEHMAELLGRNNYSALTRQWMGDKQAARLLLTIKTGDLLCVFYRLVDGKGDPGAAVFTRTFQNVDGLCLSDCADVASPEILNILGAFIAKGDGGVEVRDN